MILWNRNELRRIAQHTFLVLSAPAEEVEFVLLKVLPSRPVAPIAIPVQLVEGFTTLAFSKALLKNVFGFELQRLLSVIETVSWGCNFCRH